MPQPVVNSTDAIRLARMVVSWWDEQELAQLHRRLYLKEPRFVTEARAIIKRNERRQIVRVKPGDGPKLVAFKGDRNA